MPAGRAVLVRGQPGTGDPGDAAARGATCEDSPKLTTSLASVSSLSMGQAMPAHKIKGDQVQEAQNTEPGLAGGL